jgi:hypothetical protein
MKATPQTPAPSRSAMWTKERIDALATAEVRQLRVNAERLNDPGIVERCDGILSERRKQVAAAARAKIGKNPRKTQGNAQSGGAA